MRVCVRMRQCPCVHAHARGGVHLASACLKQLQARRRNLDLCTAFESGFPHRIGVPAGLCFAAGVHSGGLPLASRQSQSCHRVQILDTDFRSPLRVWDHSSSAPRPLGATAMALGHSSGTEWRLKSARWASGATSCPSEKGPDLSLDGGGREAARS